MKENLVMHEFAPIIDNNCEILFLGSIPSKKSRENNFYYSNPTNRFWKIMSFVFGEDFENCDNQTKKQLLLKHNVALFDVYASCEMKKQDSSLDSDITHQVFNDIPTLIKGTNIKRIFVTSKKAYKDFVKKFGKYFASQNIEIINLPSSSSANRSVYKTDNELIQCWLKLLKLR